MKIFKKEKEMINNTKKKYKNTSKFVKESIKTGISENLNTTRDIPNLIKQTPNKKSVSALMSFRGTVIFMLIILTAAIFFNSYFSISVVNGRSMENTYFDKEIVLLNRNFDINKFDYSSVIVFNSTKDTYNIDEAIIKRVIGKPGDTVEIKNGIVYVNDIAINDEYAVGVTSDYEKTTVTDGNLFVLGDNRDVSKDSRYVGLINSKDIIGVVIKKLF